MLFILLQDLGSIHLNLEGGRSVILMKNSWIHSFCVAQQGALGVEK